MPEVVIVGAGPAGLSAGIECAKQGLQVRIVDEFVKPGGRLLGQLHQEPDGQWWNGMKEAKRLYEQAEQYNVQIDCGLSVYDLEQTDQGWKVYTTQEIIDAPYVLLATGASETAVPIPGWTLPGVMSIGAAQVMTNVQRVRVGEKGMIIGVNILSVSIMRELQLAGIDVEHMVLPSMNEVNGDAAHPLKVMQSLLRVSHLAPSPLIRFGSKLVKGETLQKLGVTFYPKSGVKMWDIPIHLRKAALHIYGDEQVEGVRIATINTAGEPIPGTEKDIPVDFVCIAGGLTPLAELAAVAGCPFRYIPELGGHVPVHNANMETTLQGLYVAGNITGIESAKIAIAQGKVAGLSIADACLGPQQSLQKTIQNAMTEVEQVRDEAVIQFHPHVSDGRQKIEETWHGM